MPRAIWKGAISFGLVNVPVALYPASQTSGIDFDWLDSARWTGWLQAHQQAHRQGDRGDDIVKGDQAGGRRVRRPERRRDQGRVSEVHANHRDRDLRARPRRSRFVLSGEAVLSRALGKGGDKVYALLREAMREAGVIGIARVVLHTKEHLAALIPLGPALILNTIRWASEIRPVSELKLPADGKTADNLKPGELKMAAQLISDMTGKWKPADYTENFSAAVHKLVNRKIKAGETESVTPIRDVSNEERSSNVIDLTELLAKSLKRKTDTAGSAPPSAKLKVAPPSKKAAAKPPVRKRA